MKSAFITGISGQDGYYLTNLLLDKEYEVYGLDRRKSQMTPPINNKHFTLIEGDLVEDSVITKTIKEIQPDEVYNMAAQSFVSYSWINPIYTANVNMLGVMRILEAIRNYSPKSKFLQASSSEMFGGDTNILQNEKTYHYPKSPYGCTKSFGYNITRNYRESYNLFTTNSIAFNHESERRGLEFVTRKITNTIARIILGKTDKLVLGNLNAKRDWGYAPDYVNGMWMILQHHSPDDFILSTGETHTIKEFVDLAFGCFDIQLNWKGKGVNTTGKYNGKVIVEVSDKYYRPAEVNYLMGDNTKIKQLLNWEPTITLKQMIQKMVEYDMEYEKGKKI